MKPCLTLFDSAGRGVDGTGKDCRAPDLYHRGWCRVNSVRLDVRLLGSCFFEIHSVD